MWPNTCAVCHASSRSRAGRICALCSSRWATMRHRCAGCALPLVDGQQHCGACLQAPPPLAGAIATTDYGFPWDGLLQSFKFHDALDLAPALADAMHRGWVFQGAPPFDLLLPVPLSAARMRKRGYNQAAVLARQLGRLLVTQVAVDAVLRAVDTPAQATLSRAERLTHLRGAFVVEPAAAQRLRDMRIAIIDDVMTTGATVHELARTLQRAGAKSIHAWVLARTLP